jgi:hypothetical protein
MGTNSPLFDYRLRGEIERAREALIRTPLRPSVRAFADGALRAAAREAKGSPDERKVAELIARAKRTLEEAGALTAPCSGLSDSLMRASMLLG